MTGIFLLGDPEKEEFMKIVRAYEDEVGVEVLTFCIKSAYA